LSAQEASVAGDAAHSWVVTHDTSGTLSAGSATVSGLAQRNGVFADEVTRGVPGRPRFQRWAVTINGKRFFGSQEEIERLVREFAEEQAEKPKPKRAKIVVKPGIAKPEVEKAPEVVEQAQEIQQDMREVYAQAYRVAIQRLAEETIRREIEDEEDLLGIL
jgi:hypothetical protein